MNFSRVGRRVATVAMAVGLVVLPATSLSAGSLKLLDKDKAHGLGGVAVATGTVKSPTRFVVKIASDPPGKTVEWSYTNRCIKNNELHSFPGPGDHTILTDKTKIKETMKMPVSEPETCDVEAAAKLAKTKGEIRVKILAE